MLAVPGSGVYQQWLQKSDDWVPTCLEWMQNDSVQFAQVKGLLLCVKIY